MRPGRAQRGVRADHVRRGGRGAVVQPGLRHQDHRARAHLRLGRRGQRGRGRRPPPLEAQPRGGLRLLHPGGAVGRRGRRLADADQW